MARMLPSEISPEVKSTAEKRIFKWFKESKGTENWIVLHSLGIVNHNRNIHGETDFFVIAPGYGIYALEVKGGRVWRENGIWHFKDKYNHVDSRSTGPFDQAWNGIYSIKNELIKKFDSSHQYLNDFVFGIGVMFPDIEYESVGVDEEQWQVFDINDGNKVASFIKRIATNTRKNWEDKYKKSSDDYVLTIDDANYIADLLRGDFDFAVSLQTQIDAVEEDLLSLTKEQYKCIDSLEDNARCLVKGIAGTGKTLLAIQCVEKYVANGEKVAMFCYNKNLALLLQQHFKKNPKGLQPAFVGTLHSYMLMNLEDESIIKETPHFYEKVLPKKSENVLRKKLQRFDRIIIDEAQDIITDEYLDVLDKCVNKGLERGKWIMFGDFLHQAIYAKGLSENEMIEKLEDRAFFCTFKLTLNCRNSKPICHYLHTIINDEATSEKSWWNKKKDGLSVNFLNYDNSKSEKDKLQSTIQQLINEKVKLSDIKIISPVSRKKSIINDEMFYYIDDYDVGVTKGIAFSTIQSFKGLESKVVILIDIDSYDNESLMYVGISRATSVLYVLESHKAEEQRMNKLFEQFKAGYGG